MRGWALKILLVSLAIGMVGGNCAMAWAQKREVLFRAQAHNAGNSKFRIDLLDLNPGGDRYDFQAEVRCLINCAGRRVYRERTTDTPIALFDFPNVFQVEHNHFVTVWSAGSFYIVNIYDIDGEQIRKVFGGGSRFEPRFDSIDGAGAIILGWGRHEVTGDFSTPWIEEITTWRWTGSEYTQFREESTTTPSRSAP